MKTILHTMDTKAPPGAVFSALSSENGLAGWWTTRVSANAQVGGQIQLQFGGGFDPVMQIAALESPSLVEWGCVGGHDPWLGSRIQFQIAPTRDGSRILLRQEYVQELPDEEYGRYNYNWGYYLESLRLLVETGRGKPIGPPASAF